MASVFETILEKINENNNYFVFPSETAAFLWARKICLHGAARSLSPERFLAWDRFKEEAIQKKDKKRKPVSSLIRRLFALALAQKNAAAPFLKAIIPLGFADNSAVFAESIAALLSSLGRWEELQNAKQFRDDEEDRDLRIIKSMYAAFLQENSLFEPSWEKADFQKSENRYTIFFPEALSDFDEYKELLNAPAVNIYSCKQAAECIAQKPTLLFFDSARHEIRHLALELRRLHEEGLPYEDIAVTLPDYKNIAPYIERELSLHDIPFNRRRGNNLGEYSIGRLFSLIGECGGSLFSFDSVKSLLLDSGIPWKDREKNSVLIDYGIANHCAAPFRDRARTVDAWEEGFKQNPNEDLSAYYGKLKKVLLAMTGAKSFRTILDQYHVFRAFLAMEKCSAESDAVLARCIEELAVLIETEETYPLLVTASPFDFYVSHLRDKNYVFAGKEGGVNLYDYPVAAGAPFGCHFLLNASQGAAVVQHRPLPFLREDKRAKLGITDTDASEAMLSLFTIAPWNNYNCRTFISASEKTFAGWAIPHSVFAMNQVKANVAGRPNLYADEKKWRALSPEEAALNSEKPEWLYSVQKEGFKRWYSMLFKPQPVESSVFYSGEAEKRLKDRIHRKNLDPTKADTAELSVSASDLNDFYTCPVLWLYSRIFRLEEQQLDASLLDAESLGLIYHRILQRLFERIKETDALFLAEKLNCYFEWTKEITDSILRSNDTLRGPLVYPLLSPLASAINKKLRALLKAEARYFNNRKVLELEQNYKLFRGSLMLNGFIDRVSEGADPPGGDAIIDYKSGAVPLKSHCRYNEDNGLLDFQISMYIKLYEESTGKKIGSAAFADIRKAEFVSVVGSFKKENFSREQYQETMDELERAIGDFENAVLSLNFTRKKTPAKTCTSCKYKTMCRTLYSLNPSPDRCGMGTSGEENDD